MVGKDPIQVIRFHNAIMSITVALSVVLAAFPSAILAASRGVDPSDLVQFSKDDAPSNVELPAKPPAG